MAVRGGADIVDVKEPSLGSLGRASLENLQAIARMLQDPAVRVSGSQNEPIPLSIALGEVQEWNDSSTLFASEFLSQLASSATNPSSSSQTSGALCEAISQLKPRYMKLGLSQVAAEARGAHNWRNSWIDVRCRFSGDHEWVAVAYADHQRAHSPALSDVLEAALETNCSVLLIDTFVKDGTNLFDWLPIEAVASLRKATAAHGLQLALAGRITMLDLPALLPLQPDIVAVRGAVCEAGERTATVSEKHVAEFVERLRG